MILLNVASALLLSAAPMGAPTEYSIKVTRPAPDAEFRYYSWEVSVSVEVVAPPGDYELELSYQGVTHYLPALAAKGRAVEGGKHRWSLNDPWLPLELGEHDLELRLLSLANTGVGASGKLLAEAVVPLDYVHSAEDSPEELARTRMHWLSRAAIDHARVLDPVVDPYRDEDMSDLEHGRIQATKWLTARSKWLRCRVETLTRIGELYDYTSTLR